MGFVEHCFPFFVHRQPSSQDGLLGTGNYLQEKSLATATGGTWAAKGDKNKISSYLVQNINAEEKINQKTRRCEDSLYADVWATGERYSDCFLIRTYFIYLLKQEEGILTKFLKTWFVLIYSF